MTSQSQSFPSAAFAFPDNLLPFLQVALQTFDGSSYFDIEPLKSLSPDLYLFAQMPDLLCCCAIWGCHFLSSLPNG